jgi:short-subunit dehydrogenase
MYVIPGRIALPYMTSYAISKYGVDAFTDAFRREMKPWEVHVISIEAGGHKTKLVNGELLEQQWKDLWDRLDEDKKQDYAAECGYQGRSRD